MTASALHPLRLTLPFLAALALSLTFPLSAAELEIVAGQKGSKGYSGDGGPATQAQLNNPFGVIVGPDGDIYFCDTGNHTIRRISRKSGKIDTVVGTGESGYSGDGGPPLEAKLYEPYELRFAAGGDLYWVEMKNHLIRRLDARTNTVHTVAGTGKPGFGGDGGPATEAQFNKPHSIQFDPEGNLYVCDISNHRIRRVDAKTGQIDTWCGNGKKAPTPDGASVSPQTPLNGPRAIDIDPEGHFWLALREGNALYRIDLDQKTLHHVAGQGGKQGFKGNGGPALEAQLAGPKGVAISPDLTRVYLADTESHSVRAVHLDTDPPTLEAVAGDGKRGVFARLHGIGTDPVTGDLYVGDSENHVIQVIRGLPGKTPQAKVEAENLDLGDGLQGRLYRPVGEVAEGRPWMWRCRFPGAFDFADQALLQRGWHVAYVDVAHLFGGPEAMARFAKLYTYLTTEETLSAHPIMEGFSRGGLPAMYWAIANPDKVAGVYIDAPVLDLGSWPNPEQHPLLKKALVAHGLEVNGNFDDWIGPLDPAGLQTLARHEVPILLIAGGADTVVPWSENSGRLEKAAKELPLNLDVIVKAGAGHHPHSLLNPTPIVAWAETAHARAASAR